MATAIDAPPGANGLRTQACWTAANGPPDPLGTEGVWDWRPPTDPVLSQVRGVSGFACIQTSGEVWTPHDFPSPVQASDSLDRGSSIVKTSRGIRPDWVVTIWKAKHVIRRGARNLHAGRGQRSPVSRTVEQNTGPSHGPRRPDGTRSAWTMLSVLQDGRPRATACQVASRTLRQGSVEMPS